MMYTWFLIFDLRMCLTETCIPDGTIELFTSAELLAELEDASERPKFSDRLQRASVHSKNVVLGNAALARLIKPDTIAPVILADEDDDAGRLAGGESAFQRPTQLARLLHEFAIAAERADDLVVARERERDRRPSFQLSLRTLTGFWNMGDSTCKRRNISTTINRRQQDENRGLTISLESIKLGVDIWNWKLHHAPSWF